MLSTIAQRVKNKVAKYRDRWGLSQESQHRRIFDRFHRHTMVPADTYCANLRLVERFAGVSGAIVECGTWKGGMIAGMAQVLGDRREYCLYDSFAGLPEAQAIDGEAAIKWQADKESPGYYENCSASIDDAKSAMLMAGVPDCGITKGWFEETLPHAVFENGIAVLRMDADWYESTMCILGHLFSEVNRGGCVIIDDYHVWDGCSKAVHDFLSKAQDSHRINTFDNAVAFIVKRES